VEKDFPRVDQKFSASNVRSFNETWRNHNSRLLFCRRIPRICPPIRVSLEDWPQSCWALPPCPGSTLTSCRAPLPPARTSCAAAAAAAVAVQALAMGMTGMAMSLPRFSLPGQVHMSRQKQLSQQTQELQLKRDELPALRKWAITLFYL